MDKKTQNNYGENMLILGLLFMQSVEYVDCNTELVLKNDENMYHIDFFNVIFYEESNRVEVCRYLDEANKIEIEEEKLIPNSYYIYIDGKLLQEIIVEEGLGKTNINYVGYQYNFEKKEEKVMVNSINMNRTNRSYYILGILFLFLLLNLFLNLILKV